MRRSERGISLIALVITIIVIIILAAIAFSSSTRTITEANKSNIINNISEVSSAFHTEAVTVEGKKAAEGNTKTDEQVYNYVAKGGKKEEDFLVRSELPGYTIITKEADIGIKLPKMKLESGTGKLIDVKYVVTKEGKVFIWPPFEDGGKYYITDKDTVETQMSTNIKVGNESLTIVIDQNDGSLLDADGTSGGGVNPGENKIEIPTIKDTEYVYNNGEKIELEIQGFNEETMVLEGDIEGTEVGEYTATLKLKDKTNTTWVDGTTNDITINWKISKNEIYATLYDDGTLVLSNNNSKIEGKTVSKDYGKLSNSDSSWDSDASLIATVDIVNKIAPETLAGWFYGCRNLTTIKNIGNLDTSKVTDMTSMFRECSSLTSLDVSNFDTSNVTRMPAMFNGCSSLTNMDLSSLDMSNVLYMDSLLGGCTSLKSVNLRGLTFLKLVTVSSVFGGSYNLESVDMSNALFLNLTGLSGLFGGCSKLKSVDLSYTRFLNLTNASGLFAGCSNLESVDMSYVKFPNLTSVSGFSSGCSKLKSVNFEGAVADNITNMSGMFASCSSLTELDLSYLNTSKVTNISGMFSGCTNLKTIYVNNTWNPTIDSSVFSGCGTQTVTVK